MSGAGMHARVLRSLLVLTTLATAARADNTDPQAQTNATCASSFAWMENAESQSPCLVTAFLSGSCTTGAWIVPALVSTNSGYNNPDPTSATVCTCSWAVYNLISACTLCQGSIATNWDAYNQDCPGLISDTYFPANISYPNVTSIPFWAATDASTWVDGRFNAGQAQTFADEGKPDYNSTNSATPSATPSSTPSPSATFKPKSKSSAGPIAGGVVGGLAAIVIAAACAYIFLYKRRRDADSQEMLYLTGGSSLPGHFRSTSDTTQKSFTSVQGYAGNQQQVLAARENVTSPGSTFTHVQSLSGHTLTSNGRAQHSPSTTLPGHVEPFVGVVGNPELRKGAHVARTSVTPIGFDQVYQDHSQAFASNDDPNPISFAQAEQATGTNPPPYVETSDPTTSQPQVAEFGHRRLRGEMGSGDTVNTRITGMSGSAGGSSSSLAQMGITRTANPNRLDNLAESVGQRDEPEL